VGSIVQLARKLVPPWSYLLKCLIGVKICYALYVDIPQYPFYWSIVSVALALSLGVLITISIGFAAKITGALRPAPAALIIVTINEQKQGRWVPVERVVCVVVGCLVALLLSLLFSLLARTFSRQDGARFPEA
jgi:hypothetical protein